MIANAIECELLMEFQGQCRDFFLSLLFLYFMSITYIHVETFGVSIIFVKMTTYRQIQRMNW